MTKHKRQRKQRNITVQDFLDSVDEDLGIFEDDVEDCDDDDGWDNLFCDLKASLDDLKDGNESYDSDDDSLFDSDNERSLLDSLSSNDSDVWSDDDWSDEDSVTEEPCGCKKRAQNRWGYVFGDVKTSNWYTEFLHEGEVCDRTTLESRQRLGLVSLGCTFDSH